VREALKATARSGAAVIRDQAGSPALVRIGAGAWIASATVVMAGVGRDTIVGADAVVTRPLPDRAMAAGVPARDLRHRDANVTRVRRAGFPILEKAADRIGEAAVVMAEVGAGSMVAAGAVVSMPIVSGVVVAGNLRASSGRCSRRRV